MGVSIIILARDEADRIRPCLESVAWADEIVVVVDAATTDDTADICRAAGATVVLQPWQGFARQWQTALNTATRAWVFMMAADERVSVELAEAIRAATARGSDQVAYEVSLCNVFWGRVLRCRYPDYHLRLFRREAGRISDREVHEGWMPDDPATPVRRLQGDLIHESYRDFTHCMQKLTGYAELAACELLKTRTVDSMWPAVYHATMNFFKYQILKGGYRDGAAGLAYNTAHAIYTFYKYAKAYELTCAARTQASTAAARE